MLGNSCLPCQQMLQKNRHTMQREKSFFLSQSPPQSAPPFSASALPAVCGSHTANLDFQFPLCRVSNISLAVFSTFFCKEKGGSLHVGLGCNPSLLCSKIAYAPTWCLMERSHWNQWRCSYMTSPTHPCCCCSLMRGLEGGNCSPFACLFLQFYLILQMRSTRTGVSFTSEQRTSCRRVFFCSDFKGYWWSW